MNKEEEEEEKGEEEEREEEAKNNNAGVLRNMTKYINKESPERIRKSQIKIHTLILKTAFSQSSGEQFVLYPNITNHFLLAFVRASEKVFLLKKNGKTTFK